MIELNPLSTHIGVQEGQIVVARSQDVESIMEKSKALHNEGLHTTEMGDKLAGYLPYVLIEKYIEQKGITFQSFMADKAHVRAMLNDPNLSHFRVWKGAI